MGQKRTTIVPKAAVSRIIASAGGERVSQTAADALVILLEEKGKAIAEQAIRVAQHAGRKTVQGSDIKLAAQMIEK